MFGTQYRENEGNKVKSTFNAEFIGFLDIKGICGICTGQWCQHQRSITIFWNGGTGLRD